MCDGFSGDEIRVACKEVTMTKVRNAIKAAGQGCSSKNNFFLFNNINKKT